MRDASRGPGVPRRAILGAGLLLAWMASGLAWAQSSGEPASDRTPYSLVMLVQAEGLDYNNQESLLRSLYKRGKLKGGFVGHSWVSLSGIENGREQVVEVGLSPKDDVTMEFLQAVLDLAEYGYVNPTAEQQRNPRYEPDPISYLWRDHGNGHLQPAKEGLVSPTYAARVYLSVEQYRQIKARLDPDLPSHKAFQLTGRQCSSFVAEIAALAGIRLQHQVTIAIPREVQFGGRRVRMWTDPRYSSLTLSTPDAIEADLKRLVASGRAEDVLSWYRPAQR